jgi:GTP cyclohydrolase IB
MSSEKHFLVDVGMRDLPYPIHAMSRENPNGQPTVATINISARILQEFEARWINKFIKIVHQHRDYIGTNTIGKNILDYLDEMKATYIKGGFEFPFFMEKRTPIDKEKCLVRYLCRFQAEASKVDREAKTRFHIEIPVITTSPASLPNVEGGLFGQLTLVNVEIETRKDIYPEDIIDLVDRHALAPVYSYLSEEEQMELIQKIHSKQVSSVTLANKVKEELSANKDYQWFSVQCANFNMLHSYNTVIGTEKSMWVPMSTSVD